MVRGVLVASVLLTLVSVSSSDKYDCPNKDRFDKSYKKSQFEDEQFKKEAFAGNAFHGDKRRTFELPIPDGSVLKDLFGLSSKFMDKIQAEPCILLDALKLGQDIMSNEGVEENKLASMLNSLGNMGLNMANFVELADSEEAKSLYGWLGLKNL